jgi:hypothetical protein
LGRRGRFDFQRQNSRNPLLCQRMSVSGFKFTSASRHLKIRLSGPSWFNLPLLEERQLLAKEEILRSQGTAGNWPGNIPAVLQELGERV